MNKRAPGRGGTSPSPSESAEADEKSTTKEVEEGASQRPRSLETDAAHRAKKQAKKAAAFIASEATAQVRELMDRQVDVGADVVGRLADSVRAAAEQLDKTIPQLAGLARGAADSCCAD